MIKAVKDQSGDHLNTGDTQMSLSSTYNWELRPSKNFYAAIRLSKKREISRHKIYFIWFCTLTYLMSLTES